MQVLVIGLRCGDCMYIGPFPNRMRAEAYAQTCMKELPNHKDINGWAVTDLIVPYSVVKTVIWRRVDISA